MTHQPGGMRGFTVVWLGQLVSLLGTGMTNFAISFWIFQQTGEATALTLALFFFMGPSILFSPFAGTIIDRSNRKTVMIASDLLAGVATIFLLAMLATGHLQLWHIYASSLVAGLANSFQFPAYAAAITLMLPKAQYARANGMIALAQSASNILAPAFAGGLLATAGLAGIMAIDVATFAIAMVTLAIVHIPQPPETAAGRQGKGSFWQESIYGFRYIVQRPSLLGLQLVFFAMNFLAFINIALLAPMILARTANNEITLASVQSLGAVGGVAGGLLLSAWGGPRRKVDGVLGGMALIGLGGLALMGLGQVALVWIIASFITQFFIPIVNGSNQAIWQAKVAPDVQGRVFTARRLIAQLTGPTALLLAGPLADNLFEPALRERGGLAASLGQLVGTGPGAGMGLIFVVSGVLGAVIGLSGYVFPAIRHVETRLPDHDVVDTVTKMEEDSPEMAPSFDATEVAT